MYYSNSIIKNAINKKCLHAKEIRDKTERAGKALRVYRIL